MNFQLTDKKLNQIKADCEVVLAVNKNLKHKWVRDLASLNEQGFKGGEEEVIYLPHRKRLYAGINSLKHDDLRIGAGNAIRALGKTKCRSIKIGIYIEKETGESVQALVEGFILGAYSFQEYKSKPTKQPISRIMISTEEYGNKPVVREEAAQAVKTAETIAAAVNYARDIVNRTPADITPVTLAETAKQLAKEAGLKIAVHGQSYLEKAGMGAMLAVAKASPYPPQLIHLTYKPENPKAKITIVGKGLTYDTGGLSLKPSDSMRTMKSDKSGAGAVLGIMRAAAALKLPLELHGIIGAVENAIGKDAYKPDDVLTARNKKTIEVKNTDAEGRLVLADCLCYAQEIKPDYLVDIATLTGACIVALGEYTLGVLGYSDELKNEIKKAGIASGELTAELPFNSYLKKLLKSEVADISNISSAGNKGGAISAALFLGEFIEKNYQDRWVHLDIAGPAFVEKSWGYNPYGASGTGVRLVIRWLENLIEK